MRIAVQGLWHLGCVTAASLAEAGFDVLGLDADEAVVRELQQGRPPLHEPGLADLIAGGLASGRLTFTTDPSQAANADILWVAFDTPVDADDRADVDFVRRQVDAVMPHLRRGTLVLISSQAPAGFTGELERDWQQRGLRFACSPENLRLGKAIDCFRKPERIVIGTRGIEDRARLATLFAPFCSQLEWMSVESAEMTKHALNAFLAASVTFINELARICEAAGADAKEVERGLKSEARIGPKAYLSPGAAFAGGTLARDVRFLIGLGKRHQVETPLFRGIWNGNQAHRNWTQDKVAALLDGINDPCAAVLGLTYKPGTDTLRRSSSVELCGWLHARGVRVQAHDPAIRQLPDDLAQIITLGATPAEALSGADVVILATAWPEYRSLTPGLLLRSMRRPRLIDQARFLTSFAEEPRIAYHALGAKVSRDAESSASGAA